MSTNEDSGSSTIDVNANDSFENAGHTITAVNGSAIAVGSSVAVSNGSVLLNASGQLVFTPPSNFNGSTSFTYTVTSGGVTETATATVTVAAINDAPVNTVPASIAVTEDVASPITGISITDVDAASSTINVTLSVPAGTLAATSGGGVSVTGSGSGSAGAERQPGQHQRLHRGQRGHLHQCGQCQRERDADGDHVRPRQRRQRRHIDRCRHRSR